MTTGFLPLVLAVCMMTNFDRALELSRVYEKPVAVIPEAARPSEEFGNRFIFVEKPGQSNLVLLDRYGAELRALGLDSLNSVDHLCSLYHEAQGLRDQLQKLYQPTDGEIEKLYGKLRGADMEVDADRLIGLCIKEERCLPLLMDRYSGLDTSSEQFAQIDRLLHSADYTGREDLEMRLAILDFQIELPLDPKGAETTLRIAISGLKDYDKVWQLHMLLSQFLYEERRFDESLRFAKTSLQGAPLGARKNIQSLISAISAETAQENCKQTL
ncbi:MAG: hypothetical protein MRY21_04315 [Simkaniaceae bacterium]|nr:hypothetical protein [Simkaniaceae bacterium]